MPDRKLTVVVGSSIRHDDIFVAGLTCPRLDPGELAEEVLLSGRRKRRVSVSRSDHAEFERIGTELGFLFKPEFQGAASIFMRQHVRCLGIVAEISLVPG